MQIKNILIKTTVGVFTFLSLSEALPTEKDADDPEQLQSHQGRQQNLESYRAHVRDNILNYFAHKYQPTNYAKKFHSTYLESELRDPEIISRVSINSLNSATREYGLGDKRFLPNHVNAIMKRDKSNYERSPKNTIETDAELIRYCMTDLGPPGLHPLELYEEVIPEVQACFRQERCRWWFVTGDDYCRDIDSIPEDRKITTDDPSSTKYRHYSSDKETIKTCLLEIDEYFYSPIREGNPLIDQVKDCFVRISCEDASSDDSYCHPY